MAWLAPVSAGVPSLAGSASPRNFRARRVPEAAGRRKAISPWTAPPATTVYQTSESAADRGWEDVSKVSACPEALPEAFPETWESTFWRQVFHASHQLRSSVRSSGRSSVRSSGWSLAAGWVATASGTLVSGTLLSGTSVIDHLRSEVGFREIGHARRAAC